DGRGGVVLACDEVQRLVVPRAVAANQIPDIRVFSSKAGRAAGRRSGGRYHAPPPFELYRMISVRISGLSSAHDGRLLFEQTQTYQHIQASGVWAVNVLSAEQESISRTFAMKDIEEERTMVGTPYHRGVTGAPIIDGCISYIDCRTWATYEGGDHTIFVGQVEDAAVLNPDSPPLLFFKG